MAERPARQYDWQYMLHRQLDIRTGGEVQRCHGVRHRGEYSVAQHSWGVAMLMWELWPADFRRLAQHCLFHDVPEAWVGDIPAPTKRYDPAVRQGVKALERDVASYLDIPWDGDLPAEDRVKLSACDRLELYLWACEQMTEGNLHAQCVRDELDTFFEETPLPSPASQLLDAIRLEMTTPQMLRHRTDRVIREIATDEGR